MFLCPMSSDDECTDICKTLKETEKKCMTCEGFGTQKYVQILGVKPDLVYSIFLCKECNTRETTVQDVETLGKKIVIECTFNDINDLRRELNLNMHAKVNIQAEGIEYEFSSSEPLVTPVEGIILQALEAAESPDNCVMGDRSQVVDALRRIQHTKELYMKIEDTSGHSRVGQVGRGVYEMQDADIAEFNDDKVRHYYVEDDSE